MINYNKDNYLVHPEDFAYHHDASLRQKYQNKIASFKEIINRNIVSISHL
jgi:hypothetical protein